MECSESMLDLVFGESSTGATPAERANTSERLFVRSQDELAFMSPLATGLSMSAATALKYYGFDKLIEVADKGSAILVCDPQEPASSLLQTRYALGLSRVRLALKADVTVEDVKAAETPGKASSIHVLVKIAKALGLDPYELSIKPLYSK